MAQKSNQPSQTASAFHRPSHGGNLVWAASLADCSPAAILDFSASINPLGPPASAIVAIQSHLADLSAYPDPSYQSLRAVLCQLHSVPPDWILPGNGAAELLTWACRDLASLEQTCLLTPAFSDYRRALKAFNASILECPLEQREQLSSIAPSPVASSGLLLNNPHNPTGQLLSKDAIRQWLETFALVVVDEAFMDFLPEEAQSVVEWVQDFPNLVVVRSLTKFYSLPGLRLGYAIAHPDRLRRWQQWRDPWAVNALAAAVGEVVVKDTQFQQQTWDWLAVAKAQLFAGLSQLPGLLPYAGAANFLLVRSQRSVVELQTELLKRHCILIRDCLSFPELGDRYFRVAVRTETENQRLLEGLAEVLTDCAI
ncbi:threonine-phosphate decarboxylase [Leptolyngbya sp. FACHB-36]|uniref:threonine-phosphate decarboxylase CobD n=1 Tax=Leptolyngbya sp. FACHB-36 TaxID=2692808 RepID=UPI001680C2DA|nr:threonine-phosphate decarboxylase CobD [Leptolyngbya sp. FACHB-36]MBD2021474.1 threonine-phosphate decarboxylase [Leptolyngbya sp. FACHB-36]